jgi:hypothetical protein
MALSGNAEAAAIPEIVIPEPVAEIAPIEVVEPTVETPVIEIEPLKPVIEEPVIEDYKIGLGGIAAVAAGLGAMALSGKAEASVPVSEVVVPEPVVEIPAPKIEVVAPVIEKIVPPVVAAPIVEAATPVTTYAAVEEAAAAGSGGWWKWLLLAALLGALLWWLLKGCAGGTTTPAAIVADSTQTDTTKATAAVADTATSTDAAPVADATTPAEVAPVVAATAAATSGCNCSASKDPLFNIDANAKPKSLWRLGSNPEFGNSHALSPEQFYQKLKTRAATNAMDKKFLNRIFKAMGYINGFADAKASMFTAVELPKGTIGNIGYSKAHKTLLASLDVVNDKDLKAFHIQSANGCDMHFMKTCGNHMFICNK